MSDQQDTANQFTDAYRPPVDYGLPPVSRRPGMLTAVCVLAIVLGALGIGVVLLGSVNLAFQDQIQGAFTPAPPPNQKGKEIFDLQQAMNKDIRTLNAKFFWANAGIFAVHLVLATLLLVGGIRTMQLNPSGRKLLMRACLLTILFELGRGAVHGLMQYEMYPLMTHHMSRMANASGGPGGQGTSLIETSMTIILVVGVVFAVGLMALKLGYYVYAVFYLRRSRIVNLFETGGSEPAAT